MNYILRRFLRLLIKFKIIGKVVRITYQGKGVSLNKFYSQGHWGTRSAIKKKYRAIFDQLFHESKDLIWMEEYALIIFYNSRHDLDNVTGMEKVFMDALKQETDKSGIVVRHGYVKDDDKRYYKGMVIVPDPELPMNTFEFNILDLTKWQK